MISLPAFLVLLPLVFAYPLQHRATTLCGQFDSTKSGSYELLSNHWGQSDTSSGSQCSTLQDVEDGTVKWRTEWIWPDGNNIKSFSNIQLNDGINRRLDEISSMPSTWHWTQKSIGQVVDDITFDLFTSYSPGGSNANEVMVWLGNYNAGPISYQYDGNGQALPIASDFTLCDHTWSLYLGTNGYNPVYSFLPVDGNINTFSGDLYEFFQYLIGKGHITSTQYLTTAQAGTEATSGKAILSTTAYSLVVN